MNLKGSYRTFPELNLHTPLLDVIGCEIPILNAGMGGVARFELAAAVSIKGGLGTLGMVREDPSFISSQVGGLRDKTSKPFSVNIIPAATSTKLLQRQLDCLIELEVPIVTLFWDIDHHTISRLKEKSITVIHQVGSVEEGLQAQLAGVDALIAQGYEAGGHIRGRTSLQNLLASLSERSAIPVIAAGGIATGHQMLAAFSLGAQGVSLGTALLATEESNAHQIHKTQIVQAVAEDTTCTDSFFINWPKTAPVRVLKNPITEGIVVQPGKDKKARCREIGNQDGKPIYLFSTDSPLIGATGALDLMPLYSGHSCEQIDSVVTVAERIDTIIDDARIVFRQLAQQHRQFDVDEPISVASSPCYSGEICNGYGGYADFEEIRDTLESLLAAERAGAKVCALSMKIAPDSDWSDILRSIHRDEVSSCKLVLQCMVLVGLEPHNRIGDFVEKCLAIPDFIDRMRLLNKGQSWVVRTLDELLPRLESSALRVRLLEMKNEHLENIDLLNMQLDGANS